MNTLFDKFIEDGKHEVYDITVHGLRKRLEELEQLGMSDYKVMMFPNEDANEGTTIGVLWFHEKSVIIST